LLADAALEIVYVGGYYAAKHEDDREARSTAFARQFRRVSIVPTRLLVQEVYEAANGSSLDAEQRRDDPPLFGAVVAGQRRNATSRRIIAYTCSHEAGATPRSAHLSQISVSHQRGAVHALVVSS
jgi:hypothetical protein